MTDERPVTGPVPGFAGGAQSLCRLEAVERLVVVARNYVEADARLQRRVDTRDIRDALTALEADV